MFRDSNVIQVDINNAYEFEWESKFCKIYLLSHQLNFTLCYYKSSFLFFSFFSLLLFYFFLLTHLFFFSLSLLLPACFFSFPLLFSSLLHFTSLLLISTFFPLSFPISSFPLYFDLHKPQKLKYQTIKPSGIISSTKNPK